MKPPSIALGLPGRPIAGHMVSRPTFFALLVGLDGPEEKVYLANSGTLSTVIKEGRDALCVPHHKVGRKVSLDGVHQGWGLLWYYKFSLRKHYI